MQNKIIKNGNLEIDTINISEFIKNSEYLFRILELGFINTNQNCPVCKTNTSISPAGNGKIKCNNCGKTSAITKNTFLHRTKILSNPAKWFSLITIYKHSKNIKYGIKKLASQELNIDIKNIKRYWKKFDKLENDEFFNYLSNVFSAEIKCKRNDYKIYYRFTGNNKYRGTSVLQYNDLNMFIGSKALKNKDDLETLSCVLISETFRYTKHGINVKSQNSKDILSQALYLIYYYQHLASKYGDKLNYDFDEFAFAFVSFYYRGGRGRKLSHIIPSFKMYIYEYFEHRTKWCGGQFSPCGFCQFDDEFQPRLYKPNIAINKYEGYILKNLKNNIKDKLTKFQFEILVKFSRFINKINKNLVKYNELDFCGLIHYIYDEFVILCFRKLDKFIKTTWKGEWYTKLLLSC